MTDDIVTRLRRITAKPLGMVIDPPPHPLCQEAADEIERLRKELKREKRRYNDHLANLSRKNSELRNDIERLHKILRHVASNNPGWADPDMECRTCNDIVEEFGR